MTIGMLQVEFSIPEAHSLKDKRQVLRSLKDRILNKFNVSIAETGRQDAWQFSELTFVTIADQSDIVDKRLSALIEAIRSNPRLVVMDLHTQHL